MSYWWILCYECFYLDESWKFNRSTWRSTLVVSASRRVSCASVFGWSWRRCKCLHKSALSEENSVILSATWPSTPPPKLLSVLSSKLLKAQLIYFSWPCLIGRFWDASTRESSTSTRRKGFVRPRAGKHAETLCKTSRELGDLSCSFHQLLNKEKQTFQICRWIHAQFSFSGWSCIGLRSVDGGGRWRTVNSLCGLRQRWLLCWAGTVFCQHVGLHTISSSARRWHLNNI